MAQIVFIRHGQSVWNDESRFMGWDDVPLAEDAKPHLNDVGLKLQENQYRFDIAITSYLERSIVSVWTVLEAMNLLWVPEIRDWRLNPRHYGVLQGLMKQEAHEQFEESMIQSVRTTFDAQPPLVNEQDPRNPRLDARYQSIDRALPLGESLHDVEIRVLQFFDEVMTPLLTSGKKILVAAHEDSLKILIKRLEGLSEADAIALDLPPGKPLALDYNADTNELKRFFIE